MRADRLLSILLLLQVHRRITAAELAARLEVSERTILRDMEALSTAGIPVIAERGHGGGWALLEDYQTRLNGLNRAEIQALFVASPARVLADLGLQHDSQSALIKLQAALPAPVRPQADFARQRIHIDIRGWRDPAESVATLPVLLEALWLGRQVRFTYAGEFSQPSERVADPLGLVAKGSVWYLVATVGDVPKTYRVSRVKEAVILDTAGKRPEQFDLAKYWEQSITEFRKQLPRWHATFLAEPSVMRWVRYRGWRLEQETPEGDRVRVRVRFDAEEEALQFALSYGGAVEVIEPEELRMRVILAARAIVERHGGYSH